jgi:transposase, IS5 family
MKQISLFTSSFRAKPGKVTKREQFLGEMDQVIPWARLVKAIEPHYPKAGNGRRPMGLEKMLRIYFVQQWYNLSDPAAEEALYDSETMRRFVGIEHGQDTIPDESTICLFRHLLERHRLPDRLFAEVKALLSERGLLMSAGTIVDATIINAPSSTKNEDKARDPEMRQTKKGNQWYFGMKAHTGVDKDSGAVHTVAVSAANMHDSQAMQELLHGQEKALWGDSAYQSKERQQVAEAKGVAWHVNVKASRHRALTEAEREQNRERSRVRAIGEHPYRIVKVLWGHAKARYKGLLKNALQFFTLFALANVYLLRKKLLAATG